MRTVFALACAAAAAHLRSKGLFSCRFGVLGSDKICEILEAYVDRPEDNIKGEDTEFNEYLDSRAAEVAQRGRKWSKVSNLARLTSDKTREYAESHLLHKVKELLVPVLTPRPITIRKNRGGLEAVFSRIAMLECTVNDEGHSKDRCDNAKKLAYSFMSGGTTCLTGPGCALKCADTHEAAHCMFARRNAEEICTFDFKECKSLQCSNQVCEGI
jgi:hypothetical protein